MSVTALIPAAGSGSRMGAALNKQYLSLGGRPILAHTLSLFEQHPLVTDIIVVSPAPEHDYCRGEVIEKFGFTKVRKVVEGGEERQDSVRLGLAACADRNGEVVLVHDGVRPFFPADLIAPLLETAVRVGGCVVAVPVKDTIKEVAEGKIVATPLRGRLWQAQTPQAFPLEVLREAHARALQDGFRGTDDASLVERLGLPVAVLQGSYRNIKITTPEDMVLARAFLAEGGVL